MNLKNRKQETENKEQNVKPLRGFTLLIAVLVGSILVALGFAIYNIVSKEILLSSAGRESQFAFYAADAGEECALYWDRKQSAFAWFSSLGQISCGGGAPLTLTRNDVGHTRTTTFSFALNAGAITGPCVDVTVVKTENPTTTRIEALGHNTCVLTDSRRLERAIRSRY